MCEDVIIIPSCAGADQHATAVDIVSTQFATRGICCAGTCSGCEGYILICEDIVSAVCINVTICTTGETQVIVYAGSSRRVTTYIVFKAEEVSAGYVRPLSAVGRSGNGTLCEVGNGIYISGS